MKLVYDFVFKNYKKLVIINIIFAIFWALSTISMSIAQKYVIDGILNTKDFNIIFILIWFLFLAGAWEQLFWALTHYFSDYFSLVIRKDFRQKSVEKFNKLSYYEIIDNKIWQVSSVIGKWIQSLNEISTNVFSQLIPSSLTIIFSLIVLLNIHYFISLYILFIFIPLFSLLSYYELKKYFYKNEVINKKENILEWDILDYISNFREVRLFDRVQNFMKWFEFSWLDIFWLRKNLMVQMHIMNYKQFLVMESTNIFIIAFTIYLIVNNWYSIWNLALAIGLFSSVRWSMWNIVFLYKTLQDATINLNEFSNYLNLSEINHKTLNVSNFNELKVSNLSFNYWEINILKNINFSINMWEKVAIIWSSGEWKTTFVSILLGLLEWYHWNILINWNVLENQSIGGVFSYVPQDVVLFNNTVRYNLSFWDEITEDEKMIDILSKVELDKILKRDNELSILDVKLWNNGLKLSWGERQRLGIARALLHKAEIYIFDEITSNLDQVTEQKIINMIFDLFSDKTFLIVSHRKEILKNMDRVYELKDGILTLV